jgi:hypothetical protein
MTWAAVCFKLLSLGIVTERVASVVMRQQTTQALERMLENVP